MPQKPDRRRTVLGSLVPQSSINNHDVWKGGLSMTDYYTSSALERPQKQEQEQEEEDEEKSRLVFESKEHLELENAMKTVQLKLRENQETLFAMQIQCRSQRPSSSSSSLPPAPAPTPISTTKPLRSSISDSTTSRPEFLLSQLETIEKLLQNAGQGLGDDVSTFSPAAPDLNIPTTSCTSQLKEANACYAKALEHLRHTVEELDK